MSKKWPCLSRLASKAKEAENPINCFGGQATVSIFGSGGIPTYTGEQTLTLNAGIHSYNIADQIGCTENITFTITEPAQLTSNSVITTPITCNGGVGVVSVSANGGTAPYMGAGASAATGGINNFTITDNNGCITTTSIIVPQPLPLVATAINTTSIACNGGLADLTISASGGTAPYTGTGTFSVVAGTYTYTITDNNGCTATTTITITEPGVLSATSVITTPIICNGGSADVTVSASGGTAPFIGTGTFSVIAGTYTYTITDDNLCNTTTTIVVSQPTALVSSSSVTTPIACNGGSAVVTVSATGGTGAYSGTGTFSVIAGTYNYTVTDDNLCSSTTSIVVTQPISLAAGSAISTPISTFGGTGVITVSGNGGTAPYTGTGNFTVNSGTYTYTVTDANGCIANTTITITEPGVLSAASVISTPIACNGGSAVITVSATGGSGPYAGIGNFSVVAGTYTYTVTDANSNTATTTITVVEPNSLVANSVITTPIACNGGSAVVNVSASGGTASSCRVRLPRPTTLRSPR